MVYLVPRQRDLRQIFLFAQEHRVMQNDRTAMGALRLGQGRAGTIAARRTADVSRRETLR